MTDLFLDDKSLDQLTGIKRGATRAGVRQSKLQLQAAFLRDRGIAFILNARGKPVVLRSSLESRGPGATVKHAWQPAAIGV